jgi:hypothetical protein
VAGYMELKGRYIIIERKLKQRYAIITDILLRHKLLHLKEMTKNMPSYAKFFLFLLLLILLDLFITNYIFSITTTTERTPILAALFAFNSVIVRV